MSLTATGKIYRVMIVAGEASGDLHGSHLIAAALEKYPDFSFFGVGGDRMAAAGCRILFPADELAVMGIQEVVTRLPLILKRLRSLRKIVAGPEKPDLLILIDFPDFNLRLAKSAKAAGVKVLYYISPKVWAWRSGRARTIAQRVDRLALIFPFEPQIYRPLGVRADYVGNPLLDEFVANKPQGRLRKQLGISAHEQVVGIFPGSRNSELDYIFSALMATAGLVFGKKPQVKFLLPVAPSLSTGFFADKLADAGLPVHVVRDNIYEVAAACNAVLTVSGTVTLQLTLTKTPMAIVYKVAPLSYAVGRRLIKIEHAGLTNIVAGRAIVREFIQDDAEPEEMCREVIRLLDDDKYSTRMRADLEDVCTRLGEPGCSERVADIAHEMITPGCSGD